MAGKDGLDEAALPSAEPSASTSHAARIGFWLRQRDAGPLHLLFWFPSANTNIPHPYTTRARAATRK